MKEHDYRPIQVIPAISENDKIKFIFPKREDCLTEDVSKNVWKILAHCNGINTMDLIKIKVSEIDSEFVEGCINDLSVLGVLIDSREYYKFFHELSNNPNYYLSSITNDEIVSHENSSRLPIKTGRGFPYRMNSNSTLFSLQKKRKSCRGFSDYKMNCDELGVVLDLGYSLRRHSVPSAGNLYTMKLFVVALEDQADFPAGYYEFDSEQQELVCYNTEPDNERICYMMNSTTIPFGASVLIFIVADAERQPYKYSNRGYRFMLIEAGEIAQNISLAAVESDLASCELGGFLDLEVIKELELENCLPLLSMVLGKAGSVKDAKESIWQMTDKYERIFVGDKKPVRHLWCVDNYCEKNYEKAHYQFLAETRSGQITSGISTCFAEAKLKAIIEGYEREQSGYLKWDIVAKASELNGEWLDPRIMAPLVDCQYRLLGYLEKFSEDLVIEWIEGKYLSNGIPVYVPIDLVFYPINDLKRKPVSNTCSSGFSAHSDHEEARKRGLLEIIERDALMKNWYEGKSVGKFFETVLPVHIRKRIAYWRKFRKKIIVLNASKNGVIIIQTIIKSDSYPCFVSGAASSLNSFDEAVIKSFQEAESRLIYGMNEKKYNTIVPENVKRVLDHELLYNQSLQYHDKLKYLWSGSNTDIVPLPSADYRDLADKYEAIEVDVSEKGSPIRVIKILSKHLVPISFGYGEGYYSHNEIEKSSNTLFPHYFA